MDHDIKKLQNALNAWLAVELYNAALTGEVTPIEGSEGKARESMKGEEGQK